MCRWLCAHLCELVYLPNIGRMITCFLSPPLQIIPLDDGGIIRYGKREQGCTHRVAIDFLMNFVYILFRGCDRQLPDGTFKLTSITNLRTILCHLPMWYANAMFHYMFKAEFVNLLRL